MHKAVRSIVSVVARRLRSRAAVKLENLAVASKPECDPRWVRSATVSTTRCAKAFSPTLECELLERRRFKIRTNRIAGLDIDPRQANEAITGDGEVSEKPACLAEGVGFEIASDVGSRVTSFGS